MRLVFIFISLLLLEGCIFAPPKFGDRGFVTRGSAQYTKYLSFCRKTSPQLDESCRKWGEPVVIKIGHSGGYFAWKNPTVMIIVKSFGNTSVSTRIPHDMVPYVGGGGKAFSATKIKPQGLPQGSQMLKNRVGVSYVVNRFERVSNDQYAYDFRLCLKNRADAGLSAIDSIKRELRSTIAADYVGAHGGHISDVRIDFPDFALNNDVIEGRAAVMCIEVMSLQYDPNVQKGVIAVKIGYSRFEDARAWVRKNIETLARDKNVALTTGEIPSAARFYLGAERIKPGNILEIEFETE